MTSQATREGFARAGKELVERKDTADDSVQVLHYKSNQDNGFLIVVNPNNIGRIRS
jgi:hypothetical protein